MHALVLLRGRISIPLVDVNDLTIAFPLVDLRVELNPQPLTELRYLWEPYRPQLELYVRRALDPDSVPYPET